MGVNMDDFLNENYDSKWEILNQMFIIEKFARQAHNEIYRDNIDHMKIFLLDKKLFNKLELPEKQLLQDILANRNLMTNMVIR
jgi:hypothetical protein